MANVADIITNLLGGYAKGLTTALDEEEQAAGAQAKWMETLGGGPEGAFEMFGDQYLNAVESATRGPTGRGLRVPTREEAIFGEVEEPFTVTPRGPTLAGPEEEGILRGPGRAGEPVTGTRRVTRQTGTRRTLALPKRGRLTLADVFPKMAGSALGMLPVPMKDGEPDLSTATLVAQRAGAIGEEDLVEVTIDGKTFKVGSAQAADLALRQLQQRANQGELVDITIAGRTLRVPATTAANILNSYRIAQMRQDEGAGGEDRVSERDWERQLREGEADVASAQALVETVRRLATAQSGSPNPEEWDSDLYDQFTEAQASLVQARARFQSLQQQFTRRGQGQFPDPGGKNKGRIIRFTTGPLQGKRYRSDGTRWIEVTDAEPTVTE